MTHHTLTASVPQHLYGYVEKQVLYGMDPAKVGLFEPCVILAVTSRPSRALHFEILCESGAKWANIPLHMLRYHLPEADAPVHDLSELQAWDCHGWQFAAFQLEYLREMNCTFRTPKKKIVSGSYWFTLDHTDNGFSLYPPEHKNYNLILLSDGSGQIAAMPNNRVLWDDKSFVKPGHPLDYSVISDETYHSETSVNPQDSAFTKDLEDVVMSISPKTKT
jgi:hypothetical protein